MKVLLTGGGSIGHVAPGIAVARALQALEPETELHAVCAERPQDLEFLHAERIVTTPVPIPRLSLLFPWHFFRAFDIARRVLASFRPHVVFSKGGAVSVPVALAAKLRGIPLVLHESDAVMGRANRLIARWSDKVCLGMGPEMSSSRLIFTGNPVRPEVTEGNRGEGLRMTGFSGHKPILLIAGGSQGAQAINEIVMRHLTELLETCDVCHLTGPGKASAPPRPGYWSAPFVQKELPHLYACAALALSRGGASSIAELAANGIPSILVPLRGLAQDHQERNAREAERSRGCVVLEQANLDRDLIPIVTSLLQDKDGLARMSQAIRTLHRSDAAEKIARVILNTVHS